jgi:hypothetical protein
LKHLQKTGFSTGCKPHKMLLMEKEITASEIGRIGGRAGRGECKSRTKQIRKYWAEVRAGKRPSPDHSNDHAKRKQKQCELPL